MGKLKFSQYLMTSEKVDESINFIWLFCKIIFKQTRSMIKRGIKKFKDPAMLVRIMSVLLLALTFMLISPSTIS